MSVTPNAIAAGSVDLSDAPGSLDDSTFDSLFPAEASTVVAAPQAPASTTPQPSQAAPVTPQPQAAPSAAPDAPFIKGDRTVYKDRDAAIQGINQKDALIEQLRQRYALTTGIDPITGQPVGQATPQSTSYNDNPDAYLKDLYEAAQKGPAAYQAVQQKFIMDTLAPLQPVISHAVKDQALGQLSSEIKDIGSFVNSSNYSAALEANPDLKNAITVAETDGRFHSRLPYLYKTAYYVSQGMQLPNLLKAQATQPVTQTQTPPRPTIQSTTASTPTETADKASFRDLKGIRATIKEMEAKGINLDSWG